MCLMFLTHFDWSGGNSGAASSLPWRSHGSITKPARWGGHREIDVTTKTRWFNEFTVWYARIGCFAWCVWCAWCFRRNWESEKRDLQLQVDVLLKELERTKDKNPPTLKRKVSFSDPIDNKKDVKWVRVGFVSSFDQICWYLQSELLVFKQNQKLNKWFKTHPKK